MPAGCRYSVAEGTLRTVPGKNYYLGRCCRTGVVIVKCPECDYCFDPNGKSSTRHNQSVEYILNKHYKNKHPMNLHPNKKQKKENGNENTPPLLVNPQFRDDSDDEDELIERDGDDIAFDVDGVISTVKDDEIEKEEEEEEEEEDIKSLASEECQGHFDQHYDNVFDEDEDWMVMGHNDDWTTKHDVLEDILPSKDDYATVDYIDDDFGFFSEGIADACMISPNQMYMLRKYQSKAMDPNDDTGGYRSLCGWAIGNSKTASTTSATHKQGNLLFRLNSALLSAKSGTNSKYGSSRDEVMDLVASILEGCEEEAEEKSKIAMSLCGGLPRTAKAARTSILEGPNSIMGNFPVPKVFTIDNHACVSLKEVIRILAGHDGDFEFLFDVEKGRSTDGLNGTVAADELLEKVKEAIMKDCPDMVNETNVGWVYFWSDSFLKCFIKQKENSVWLFTVTICPKLEDIGTGRYTQVLAIGKSGQDHSGIISHYHREIQKLMKPFKCYFGSSNKISNVAFGLLYHAGDRPERFSILNTLSEGHFGRVTNWSANPSREKFPACKKCYDQIVQMVNDNNFKPLNCDDCFGWELRPGDPAQDVCPVPNGYPKDTLDVERMDGSKLKPPLGREPGRENIGPVRLSTDWLILASEYAYEAVRIGKWNATACKAYLRSCNISESRRKIIYEAAVSDRRAETRRPTIAYVPDVWMISDCFDTLLPDMPLHLLAHGIGDDVIHLNHSILTSQGAATDFARFANRILADIASFNLDWCKPKLYPKSAWIGENVMAFVRLSAYLYSMYLLTNPLKDDASVIQDSLKRMLNAFLSLYSVLMSTKVAVANNTSLISARAKLFLSTAHQCDLDLQQYNRELGGNVTTTTSRKRSSVVDELNREEIEKVLTALQVEFQSTDDLRKSLDKLTTKDLQKHLKDLNLRTSGKNKTSLQLRLFGCILDRELTLATQNEETMATNQAVVDASDMNCVTGDAMQLHQTNVHDTQTSTQSLVWEKGGWLSLVINVPKQIKRMGPLRWIWLVSCLTFVLQLESFVA